MGGRRARRRSAGSESLRLCFLMMDVYNARLAAYYREYHQWYCDVYRRIYCYYATVRRRRLAAVILVILMRMIWRRRRRRRRCWVQNIVGRRMEQGLHHNLIRELSLEDNEKYRRCLRMDTATFEYLLGKVSPIISKQDTTMRLSISAAERLHLTLRFLATGESQMSLHYQFRIGQSTISGIIRDTCQAIYDVLSEEFLQFPSSKEHWRAIGNHYGKRWNFYNCLGALDGKHVRIECPLKSGSMYHNFKEFYSIVLMALVDAQLRFIWVDVGTNGRASDKGIWNRCTLKAHLDNNLLDIPPPEALPGTNEKFPYVIVGDGGFTLSSTLLMPYTANLLKHRNDRRIFNYRLSRARRCSENAFGVMGARFQVFRAPLRYDPEEARRIVLACLCLHNMLRTQTLGEAMYAPPSFVDMEDEVAGVLHRGQYRECPTTGLENIPLVQGGRPPASALDLRDRWCAYFNSAAGKVPWQERMAGIQRLEE